MRITSVEIIAHERPGVLVDERPITLGVLTIRTDDGAVGHAFVGGAQTDATNNLSVLARVVRPRLIGRDPLDIGIIWSELWELRQQLGTVVIGAVDVALWDLAGRVAGLPVHRLLGTARLTVPVYISGWVQDSVEDFVADAMHYQALGVTAYKIHPPTFLRRWRGRTVPIGDDIAVARAVREAVGPDMTLLFDAWAAYSYEEALRVGRVLEELDYYWFEDPLRANDPYNYRRLAQHLDIPLLATELTDGGPFNYSEWIRAQATQYLRGDVAYKGGITALLRIARTAEVFGLNFETHDGFNALNNLAGLHVTMATPNTSFFEVLTKQPAGVFGLESFSYGLAEPFRIASDGTIAAPEGPGLGVEIDWDLIRSRQLGEL